MDLTYKQRIFVNAYVGEANGSASEAARIAGYGQPHSAGPRLLANERISSLISRRVAQVAMSADEVLARLSEHASVDMGDFLDENGEVDVKLLKKGSRGRLVRKLKVTKRTTTSDRGETTEVRTEIELHSPQSALDKLAQYHGLYRDAKAGGEADGAEPKRRIVIPEVDDRFEGRERPGEAPEEREGGGVPA